MTLAKTLRDSRLPQDHVEAYLAGMADPGALTGALNWYRGMPFSMREPDAVDAVLAGITS